MSINEYNNAVNKKIDFLYRGQAEKCAREKKGRKLIWIIALPTIILMFFILKSQGTDLYASIIIPVLVMGGMVSVNEYKIFDGAKKKSRRMRFELSDITERIAILLDAGIPLWNAFVVVSENADESKPLEIELKQTVNAFVTDSGYYFEPEKAFQEMAERCGDSSVSSFVSLIIQNSRKGGGELSSMLRLQAVNQRQERKTLAKQLADEASTLMVIPSVITLAAIMVLVGAPAIIEII